MIGPYAPVQLPHFAERHVEPIGCLLIGPAPGGLQRHCLPQRQRRGGPSPIPLRPLRLLILHKREASRHRCSQLNDRNLAAHGHPGLLGENSAYSRQLSPLIGRGLKGWLN
eukprot:6411653-Pyramimonas_sp.AAC.1